MVEQVPLRGKKKVPFCQAGGLTSDNVPVVVSLCDGKGRPLDDRPWDHLNVIPLGEMDDRLAAVQRRFDKLAGRDLDLILVGDGPTFGASRRIAVFQAEVGHPLGVN